MRKQLLTLSLTTLLSAPVAAYDSVNGFENAEELGTTLGKTVDTVASTISDSLIDGINYIFQLPNDTKKWTVSQVEELKGRICEKPQVITKEVIKEVEAIKEVVTEVPVEVIKEVEKIVYVDKIIEVPAKPKERQCTTNRQSDRFGNVDETITCTEWK